MAGLPPLRTVLRQAGALLVAAALAAGVAALVIPKDRPAPPDEGEIALSTALQRQPSPLWIDARSDGEYRVEHVPGALPLNAENWESLVPKVLEAWEPGRAAIVYCNSAGAQASREVAERLRDFKLGAVFILHGGWKAWKSKR